MIQAFSLTRKQVRNLSNIDFLGFFLLLFSTSRHSQLFLESVLLLSLYSWTSFRMKLKVEQMIDRAKIVVKRTLKISDLQLHKVQSPKIITYMVVITIGLVKKSSRSFKILLWNTSGVCAPIKSRPAKLGESNINCISSIASLDWQEVGRQMPIWMVFWK